MHVDDDEFAAWLDGRIEPVARRRLHAHIDACGSCRRLLVEAVRARSGPLTPAVDAAKLAPGHELGRYVILSRVGAGCFGTVYEAFDPSLDRRVALKVLPLDDERRQLAEARALARVRHLNSVAVFDVGVAHGCLYIAMELLEAGTLQQWLASEPSWREVLSRYLDAGRGLAAAHAAGVVHRDFKPANVLLDVGRVCVADYGLADARVETLALDAPVATPRSRRLVGTPAYLAPELIVGGEASAASDQFAFCVSLAEALGRQRPFAGQTLAEVLDEIRARRVRALPAEIPAAIVRAVARGLSPEPAQRWPSMPALLEALESAAQPRRASIALVAAGLGLAAAVAFTVLRPRPCEGVEAPVRAAWNTSARATLTAQFAGLGRAWAPSVERSTLSSLDTWADRWAAQRIDSCRATRVRLEQSEAALDLRSACLDRQLAAFQGVLVQLGEADEAVLARAPMAVTALPLLEECADLTALTTPVPPPADPTQRALARTLEADLSRAAPISRRDASKKASSRRRPSSSARLRWGGDRPKRALCCSRVSSRSAPARPSRPTCSRARCWQPRLAVMTSLQPPRWSRSCKTRRSVLTSSARIGWKKKPSQP